MKRVLLLFVCLVMAITVTLPISAASKLPYQTLKYILIGNKDKDFDLVLEKINKVLKEKINATLDVTVVGWGETNTKIPLLFASGEDFDMIYSASWFNYGDQATKGGYLKITNDMIKKYLPLTNAQLPKNAWEEAKVKGNIYMVPSNYTSSESKYYWIRGDLREKYGLPEVKTINDFEKYLDAVAKNEPGMIPYGDRGANSSWQLQRVLLDFPNHWTDIYAGVNSLAWLDYYNPKAPLFNILDKPEFLAYAKKMVDWKNKGYWSKSALTQKDGSDMNAFKIGKSAATISYLTNANAVYTDWQKSHPDWKLEITNANVDSKILRKSYLNDGISIHATSKRWQRALMAIDLLGYNKDLHNLLLYGIKGRHYDLDANGKKIGAANSADYSGSSSIWNFRNFDTFPDLVKADGYPNYELLNKEERSKLISNPYASLTVDTTNIKSECAAVNEVMNQYSAILQLGFTDDPEKTIAEFKAKLKAAGADKIFAEIQAQATAHLKLSSK